MHKERVALRALSNSDVRRKFITRIDNPLYANARLNIYLPDKFIQVEIIVLGRRNDKRGLRHSVERREGEKL